MAARLPFVNTQSYPLICYEDDDLLVVNKPAGWNTHAPSPYAGEGIFDWLRHREPKWASLALIHRLDKDTSGVLLFAKTPLANRSLTEQFTQRRVRKRYWLLTDRDVPFKPVVVRSGLVRVGERYRSRGPASAGMEAETWFAPPQPGEGPERLPAADRPALKLVVAEPRSGRTHQIRVHAADRGFPVLGDTLYGGSAAQRVCLHAAELSIDHPATGTRLTFRAPVDFGADQPRQLRAACLDPARTDLYRLVHGAADGMPGWYVDRLGDYLLAQSESNLTPAQHEILARWIEELGLKGAYHKLLRRHVRGTQAVQASPRLVLGAEGPGELRGRENGVAFWLSFNQGYSVGLFLDQRDNRRRLLANHVAAGFPVISSGWEGTKVLNLFAYTCGFSVCAALAGAQVTNVDLSRKYLEWGQRNFRLNSLAPEAHEFLHGDAFEWLRRLRKAGRLFEVVLLDPPTFSTSKSGGRFEIERDYGRLVASAAPLVKSGGCLFASANAVGWTPERFLAAVAAGLGASGHRKVAEHYAPQPPDFPVCRAEPAHLKSVWVRLD